MKLESMDKFSNDKRRRAALLWLTFFCVLAVIIAGGVKFYEMEMPQVSVLTDIERFGANKRMVVAVSDSKSGVREVSVALVQGEKKITLHDRVWAREGIIVSGPKHVEEEFVVDTPSLGLVDGEATLVVTAYDFSWWNWQSGNAAETTFPVIIDTIPPKVRITASPTYVNAGGAGVVVYRLNEKVVKHGVYIGEDFHPGFPLPVHGENAYGAMFGIRYDAGKITEASVTAVDEAGNAGKASFGVVVRRLTKNTDRINVSDRFLASKLPEFADYNEKIEGEPLEQYLVINNRIREENNKRIFDICSQSSLERYWRGEFARMAKSSNRAEYADYRTYYYNNREIDKQVHLGIDLASTKHAMVGASNRGKVVFGEYLGIYGNTVIVDHGGGVFSLYSHLSKIEVKVGDMVKKGYMLGRTGTSGMAGGDHLHFAVLVNGIFVNPHEWWDGRWLKYNIEKYL